MLKSQLSEDGKKAALVIVCDQCSQLIDAEHGGICMWQVAEKGPAESHLYFFHTGPCNRLYEQNHPGRWAWFPMSSLPRQITTALRRKGGA